MILTPITIIVPRRNKLKHYNELNIVHITPALGILYLNAGVCCIVVNIVNKREKIAGNLKFAKDAVLGLPMVTVMGNCEVFVENFKSIVHYECDCIRLITKQGYISIEGGGLRIQYYNDEEIAIKGRISKIEYF